MSNITGIIRAIPTNAGTVISVYNEVSAVASSATVVLNTYTVPLATEAVLQRIEIGGQNIATYEVFVNAIKIDRKRTYFGSNLSTEIVFDATSSSAYTLSAGDVLQVKVTNFRPTPADFESRIQVIEIT